MTYSYISFNFFPTFQPHTLISSLYIFFSFTSIFIVFYLYYLSLSSAVFVLFLFISDLRMYISIFFDIFRTVFTLFSFPLPPFEVLWFSGFCLKFCVVFFGFILLWKWIHQVDSIIYPQEIFTYLGSDDFVLVRDHLACVESSTERTEND